MLFVQKLPTLEPETRNALKHHIIRKRQRLKQELEQDAIEKRLKKERELKQQQDAMTLDQIKDHLSTLENRLESLKDKKNDLFMQLKQVLNEESNKKKQLHVQKQSSTSTNQELESTNTCNVDSSNPPDKFNANLTNKPNSSSNTNNHNNNNNNHQNDSRLADNSGLSAKVKQTSPINNQDLVIIDNGNNSLNITTNNIYNYSLNSQHNQQANNDDLGLNTNSSHHVTKSSAIEKYSKQQQNEPGPNNLIAQKQPPLISNSISSVSDRPTIQSAEHQHQQQQKQQQQQHDHPIHSHQGHKSQAISIPTSLTNSRPSSSPRSISTNITKTSSLSLSKQSVVSQHQQQLPPHLTSLSPHTSASGPYHPNNGPHPYSAHLQPYLQQHIPTSMNHQSTTPVGSMDKQSNNNNNDHQRHAGLLRHRALGPLGPLGALPPELMGSHFDALAQQAATAVASSNQHKQHPLNGPPTSAPPAPPTTPGMSSLPPNLDHLNPLQSNLLDSSNNNNNNLNKNINYLNSLNGLSMPKRSSSMSAAEAVYLEELAVQAARKRQSQLTQGPPPLPLISMQNNNMLSAASLYGPDNGANSDANNPAININSNSSYSSLVGGPASLSSLAPSANQQQPHPHPGSPYNHLLTNLPAGLAAAGFPSTSYGQVSSTNLTPTSMGLSIPTSIASMFPHNHPFNNRKSLPYPLSNYGFDHFLAANSGHGGGKPASAAGLIGLPNMSPFYVGGAPHPPPPSSSAGPNLSASSNMLLSNPNLYPASLMPASSADSDPLASHFASNSPYSQHHPALNSIQQSFPNQNRLNSNGNNNLQQQQQQLADAANRYLAPNSNSHRNRNSLNKHPYPTND